MAAQVAFTTLAGRDQDEYGSLDALGYLLLAIGPFALVFRRRYPIPALLFTFAVTATYWTLDFPDGPVFFALGAALITTIVIGYRRVSVAMLAAGSVRRSPGCRTSRRRARPAELDGAPRACRVVVGAAHRGRDHPGPT